MTILTCYTHHDGSYGGISPASEAEWLRALQRHGHAVLTDSRTRRPMNHNIIGIGVGHNDAMFAETRGRDSMAAYYENGEAFRGLRWWDEGASQRYYYDQEHPKFADKTGRRFGPVAA